jgi:hypothetical protein
VLYGLLLLVLGIPVFIRQQHVDGMHRETVSEAPASA